MPVVGADNNGFMGQEIELKDAGLVGINVTNPPAVGGAGLAVALDVLEGKEQPHLIHLTPEVYDSSTPEGQAWLKAFYDPKGRSEQRGLQPGQALHALYRRAGEGLQGPGRI